MSSCLEGTLRAAADPRYRRPSSDMATERVHERRARLGEGAGHIEASAAPDVYSSDKRMDPRVTAGSSRAARRRRGRVIDVALAALVAVMMHAAPARADNVDTLIEQLDDSSDKIRLSAALNLAKLGDPRAIEPLVRRLRSDGEKNVRGAAAKGLGTLVTDRVKGKPREAAIKALSDAKNNDAS